MARAMRVQRTSTSTGGSASGRLLMPASIGPAEQPPRRSTLICRVMTVLRGFPEKLTSRTPTRMRTPATKNLGTPLSGESFMWGDGVLTGDSFMWSDSTLGDRVKIRSVGDPSGARPRNSERQRTKAMRGSR